MKCDELQQRLDDYLDGDLDTILVSMLEQHVASCDSCQHKVRQAKLVQLGLKQLKHDQVSDDFVSSAFAAVRRHYPETQKNNDKNNHSLSFGTKTGFITALAAGFALWAVLTTFILPTTDSDVTPKALASKNAPTMSILNLKIDQTKVIRLAINTPENFDKVTLSVILPAHVELKGHKNKREISWESKLAKGNNILRIPLKAIESGQGEFIARIAYNGKVKTFKLFLKSSKPDLSHLHTIELQV